MGSLSRAAKKLVRPPASTSLAGGLGGLSTLRPAGALKASGDFDAYWAFYEHQELRRNHLVRYVHETLPKLRKPLPLRRKTDLSVVP